MKKTVIVFLLSLWICVSPAFAGSRAVIHGIIEPVVITEIVSMQLAPESALQEGSLQPNFNTNAANKEFVPQTVVEHIGGVTVYTFVAL